MCEMNDYDIWGLHVRMAGTNERKNEGWTNYNTSDVKSKNN